MLLAEKHTSPSASLHIGLRLRVHSMLETSRVNGPGRRAVIWLQGCSLRCKKCWNPATHLSDGGLEMMTVTAVAGWVRKLWNRDIVSGLTVSGGEPMEQALALATALETLHDVVPALSIGLFSGYSETELDRGLYQCATGSSEQNKRLWRRIRRQLDFAVLGRYNHEQPSSDPLITSRNQALRLYSDRYSLADFSSHDVEVSIDATGLTQITGFPVRGPFS